MARPLSKDFEIVLLRHRWWARTPQLTCFRTFGPSLVENSSST